jgi:hypothetical protein
MTEPPPYPETDDPGARPNRESTPSQADDTTHRQEPARGSWASKVVIVIVAALVIVMVVLHLTGVIGPGTH